jgi:uncharacterized membrane protein YkoI
VYRRITAGIVALALGGIASVGIANADKGPRATASGSAAAPSRLDDGKALLPQAKISEQQAIDAAQTAASGALNEVDLEHYDGRLVFNVDVGAKDVKVDAANGDVVAAPADD